MELRRAEHHIYRLQYHLVWTPKYRRAVFAERAVEMDEREGAAGCRCRLKVRQLAPEPCGTHVVANGLESKRLLRMGRTCLVTQETGMKEEPDSSHRRSV